MPATARARTGARGRTTTIAGGPRTGNARCPGTASTSRDSEGDLRPCVTGGCGSASAIVILGSFAVLGYFGRELYRQAPPVPERVVTTDGRTVYTGEDIQEGQNVWQSMGGQEVGTVWGHGAYVAPDWSADYLHREATWILDRWARDRAGSTYAELGDEDRAALKARLKAELRRNTYDPETGDLTVSPLRAEAMAAVAAHYAALFGDDPELDKLRDAYAIPADSIKTPERQRTAQRLLLLGLVGLLDEPARRRDHLHEQLALRDADRQPPQRPDRRLVGRQLRAAAGRHRRPGLVLRRPAPHTTRPTTSCRRTTPCSALQPTPSMRATLKYFWVVTALIVAQVGLGAVTAHYGVEGSGFYGIPLAKWLPYSVTRTWHTQLAHLLDRHRLAGHRPVHGPGRLGPRAEVPAAGGQLPVRLRADHRRRVDGRPVVRRPAAAGQRGELLVRAPGLRIRRPGPVLADLPRRRPVPLAGDDGPRDVAGLPQARHQPAPAGPLPASPRRPSRCSTSRA